MRRVIIESPYAGDIEANVAYGRACIRDSLERGEAPIASHLLYTQPGILNDHNPAERLWGIKAGLAWVMAGRIAERVCTICAAKVSRYPEGMCCHCQEMPWPVAALAPKARHD